MVIETKKSKKTSKSPKIIKSKKESTIPKKEDKVKSKSKTKKEIKPKTKPNSSLCLEKLYKFYGKEDNLQIFLNINKKYSKRIFEWFVTFYASSTPVIINGKDTHKEYRKVLNHYSKKLFDPYRRDSKIIFEIKDYKIDTSVSQLNFFKWLIQEKNILTYIIKNYDELHKLLKSKTTKTIKAEPKSKSAKALKIKTVTF